MGIMQASIPLFFVLIAVELLSARLGRRSFYRVNDTISDLSAGTLSQVAGMFTTLLLIGAYGWVSEHARLQRVLPVPAWPDAHSSFAPRNRWLAQPLSWVGWTVAFVDVDLAYYWFHRVPHEVNLFWAGHEKYH